MSQQHPQQSPSPAFFSLLPSSLPHSPSHSAPLSIPPAHLKVRCPHHLSPFLFSAALPLSAPSSRTLLSSLSLSLLPHSLSPLSPLPPLSPYCCCCAQTIPFLSGQPGTRQPGRGRGEEKRRSLDLRKAEPTHRRRILSQHLRLLLMHSHLRREEWGGEGRDQTTLKGWQLERQRGGGGRCP